MPSKKPPSSEPRVRRPSISVHAGEWIQRFSGQLEDEFIEAGRSISTGAAAREYQDATVRAVLWALLDSGMDIESIAETFGRVLIEERRATVEWNSAMNQRRFDLIDKENFTSSWNAIRAWITY